MINDVLCTAPLTSILIDTNKGVRPCCYYEGTFLGNIKEQTIPEILSNEKWKKLKEQMYAKEWPTECLWCKKIEDDSGVSLRHSYIGGGGIDTTGWEDEKLTIIEFNGSNICNLACLHCHGGFSSKWVIEAKKIKQYTIAKQFDPETQNRLLTQYRAFIELTDTTRYQPTTNMHLADTDLVVHNLKQVDLSNLKMAIFKGGEPLLNSETVAALEYLDELNMLGQLEISISTNGTYINESLVKLFRKCRKVQFLISVDGVGELFNYIRYGDAKFDDIEKVLAVVNDLSNIDISFNNTAMNYNAFNLVEIRDWAIEMSKKYNRVSPHVGFNNFVQSPAYLSMSTLSDDVRKELVKYYTENSIRDEFNFVINVLKNDRLGDDIHFKWVEYTEIMETLRGNSITSIVPQLINELKRK